MSDQKDKEAALQRAVDIAKFAGFDYGIRLGEIDRTATYKLTEALKYSALSNSAATAMFEKIKAANVLTGELAKELDEAAQLLDLGGKIVLSEMRQHQKLLDEKESMLSEARRKYSEASKSDEVTDVAQAAEYLANINKQ